MAQRTPTGAYRSHSVPPTSLARDTESMLSIQFLRDHPDEVRRSLDLRHSDAPIDQALALDEQRRSLLTDPGHRLVA